MLNYIGPSIEPSGTPKVVSNQGLQVLFTLVLCFLFDKQSWTSFKAGKLNPYVIFKQDGSEDDLKELLMFVHKKLANMSKFSLINLIGISEVLIPLLFLWKVVLS